jgi:hypothetical protein
MIRDEIENILERGWRLGVFQKFRILRKSVMVSWHHDLGRWGYEARWHRLPLTEETLERLKEAVRQAEAMREL